jgi:hypothetical protein
LLLIREPVVSLQRCIVRRVAQVRNLEKKAEIGGVGGAEGSGRCPCAMERNHDGDSGGNGFGGDV